MIKRAPGVPIGQFDIVMKRHDANDRHPARLVIGSYLTKEEAETQAAGFRQIETRGHQYYTVPANKHN